MIMITLFCIFVCIIKIFHNISFWLLKNKINDVDGTQKIFRWIKSQIRLASVNVMFKDCDPIIHLIQVCIHFGESTGFLGNIHSYTAPLKSISKWQTNKPKKKTKKQTHFVESTMDLFLSIESWPLEFLTMIMTLKLFQHWGF